MSIEYRWGIILLKDNREEPTLDPPDFFVCSVWAWDKEIALEKAVEKHPTAKVMYIDRMVGFISTQDYLNCWVEWMENQL